MREDEDCLLNSDKFWKVIKIQMYMTVKQPYLLGL